VEGAGSNHFLPAVIQKADLPLEYGIIPGDDIPSAPGI
jgi:hypothetical protein